MEQDYGDHEEAAQAQAPHSTQQPLQDFAEVSCQAGYKQDYLDALRVFSSSQFTSPVEVTLEHGILERETLTFPVYKYSDPTSNMAQKRSYRSRLQELVAGQSKTPAKVLNAVEDQVLVFDMATGNTRMGLLCHDPMGSRAVLVGLVPNYPANDAPETVLPDQQMPVPTFSPKNCHSNFWSNLPTKNLKSSGLSSGSYPEAVLVHKESTLHLEEKDAPQPGSPQRVRMFRGPVPMEVPLQFGERLQDPGWSKPDADRNEADSAIWMLDPPKTQSPPEVPTKRMSSERPPEPATSTQIEDRISHEQKEGVTTPPDNPQAEGAGPAPVDANPPPVEPHPQAEKSLLATQPNYQLPAVEQPPFNNQSSFLSLHSLPGTPLDQQQKLTGEPPLPQEPSAPQESVLSKASYITGESVQAPALHQESEIKELSDHGSTLRVSPSSEEAGVHLNREKGSLNDIQNSKSDRGSWKPGNSAVVQKETPSQFTLPTPSRSCKVLPMMGTNSQNTRFKLTAEDVTHSPMVSHLGLLRGTCYEVVSPTTVLPVHSPVLCHQSASPYQNMAAVVIDTGSGFTKCGLAGEDHVLSVVSSCIQLLQQPAQGQPRYVVPENGKGSYSVLNRGVVSDWDALEVLWQHLFYCRLGMRPEELAVLVADSPISPRTNREKVAEILFERFHVPAMQTVHQALLALYAYGRTTGLVLGSGHGTSYVAPVLTGDLAPMDTYRLDVAGCDLTDYLAQLLLASGQSLPGAELVNQIKEACCYVAMDMAAEWARTEGQAQVNFVLPDKQVINVGSERFSCTEALFQPHLLGLNQPGLPQLALLSISRLEAKQQEQLLANVVLEGGTTLVRGFPERVRQELSPRATVLGSPHRAVAAWLGGSIMASREAFQSLWLSRREYEEEGPWAIYKYQL
ncbi:uncharacterized protein LOC130037767 [Sorex fumeus]|uniref:uncharacterized protein LOC130037767 n=1 Tax=Sorex fumeus TaxID=62283 RepID=UPI0024AE4126|nr:uncharacterized protein LOC130037767 [Sorex fumeus]